MAAAAEKNAIIGSIPVQNPGVDTSVDEVRLITVINDDDNNDHNDDREKECYEQDDTEIIANGVTDVEYHIHIPGLPVSTSNLQCGTRTRQPTIILRPISKIRSKVTATYLSLALHM